MGDNGHHEVKATQGMASGPYCVCGGKWSLWLGRCEDAVRKELGLDHD